MKQLSKKQAKKQAEYLKEAKQGFWKTLVICILIDFLLASVLLGLVRDNTPLSKQQLSTVSGTVERAQSKDGRKSGLFVVVDGQEYFLRWVGGDGNELRDTYAKYLNTTNPRVTLTVLEYHGFTSFRRIVAISDEQYTFNYSEKINRLHERDWIGFIIFDIIVALLVLPFEVLFLRSYVVEYRDLKKAKKRHDESKPLKE